MRDFEYVSAPVTPVRDYDAGIFCREGVVGTLVLEPEGNLVVGHCIRYGTQEGYIPLDVK